MVWRVRLIQAANNCIDVPADASREWLFFLCDDAYGVIILGLRRGAYQSPAAAVAVAAFVLAVRHPDSLVVLALRVQLAHRPPSAERAASGAVEILEVQADIESDLPTPDP